MELATWLFMVSFAYGFGILWHGLLLGRLPVRPYRVAAYPFILMVLAETVAPVGPTFIGFHPGIAVIASFIGVVIDWLTSRHRQSQTIDTLETRISTAQKWHRSKVAAREKVTDALSRIAERAHH